MTRGRRLHFCASRPPGPRRSAQPGNAPHGHSKYDSGARVRRAHSQGQSIAGDDEDDNGNSGQGLALGHDKATPDGTDAEDGKD